MPKDKSSKLKLIKNSRAKKVLNTKNPGSPALKSSDKLYSPKDFKNPFKVNIAELNLSPFNKKLFAFSYPVISKALGLSFLAKSFDQLPPWRDAGEFIERTLNGFNIKYRTYPLGEVSLPQNKPLIIACNHPFGALEALILYSIIKKERPNTKFLANFLLQRIGPLKDLFFYVDPFEGDNSKEKNLMPLRQALSWLNEGGCLITFPSGTVSHFQFESKEVRDPVWNTNISKLAKKTGATVVPFFIHGRNSILFQILGLIHPILRTTRLVKELSNKAGKTISIQVGSPISPEKLSSFKNHRDSTDYIRMRCYILKNSPINQLHNVKKRTKSPISRSLKKIIPPVAPLLLEKEILAIPESNVLIERNSFKVAWTTYKKSPNTLKEIGRLREIAFREVGEGTGTECDLDFYDSYYKHLICWNKENFEIVGAYRFIKTDLALKAFGVKGLYTNSLFKYKESLIEELGKSLEIGRSFISPNYQRSIWPLHLLLKALTKYVHKNPSYNTLFGPVSISNSFTGVSRQLIELYLRENNFNPPLSSLVRPKAIPVPEKVKGIDQDFFSKNVKDFSEMSEVIHDLELKEKGVPVLLREYTKLGGKIIGFNVDPNFNGALDGLIVVDLSQTDQALLRRYLSKEERESFFEFHEGKDEGVKIKK